MHTTHGEFTELMKDSRDINRCCRVAIENRDSPDARIYIMEHPEDFTPSEMSKMYEGNCLYYGVIRSSYTRKREIGFFFDSQGSAGGDPEGGPIFAYHKRDEDAFVVTIHNIEREAFVRYITETETLDTLSRKLLGEFKFVRNDESLQDLAGILYDLAMRATGR